MQRELRAIEKGVMTGVKKAGNGLKEELRDQVVRAGLGVRLSKTWRSKFYPDQGTNATSLIYSKADKIIESFDRGVVIRSTRGMWLAIPSENAPKKGTDGKRVKPNTFPEHRFGELRFIYRGPGKASLLIADNLRASYSRKTGQFKGFRKATESAIAKKKGLASAVMFYLVPQVKMKKKLNVNRAIEKWQGQVPALIDQAYSQQD